MTLALAGLRLWITRPEAQAGYLAASLSKHGAQSHTLPLLTISPPNPAQELQNALAQLEQFDLAIFISPSALDQVMLARSKPWPSHLPVAVIGPGSAERAAQLGMQHIICPAQQFDGEGLLATLGEQTGKKIVLFRGNGGRDILPAGLIAAGASVQLVTAYQRTVAALDRSEIEQQLALGCDGIIISSSEAAQHLLNWAGEQAQLKLQCRLYFVPHPRIAAALKAHGAQHIVLTEAGDDGITRSICRYFSPVSSQKV